MELGDGGAARQWRSYATLLRRVEEAKENEKWNGERVWQARGVQVVASGSRTAVARGRAVRRPAIGVLHVAFVF